MTTCKNCGSPVAENFCPKCGQKADTERFTAKHIIHDFFHVFTHVDSGLPYLIKELFIRPGTVIREYIQGKRKKYFNPFQYLVLSIAAVVFITVKFDLGALIIGGELKMSGSGEGVEPFKIQFTAFLYQYINIFQFVTIPITSVYSYLLYRKSGYNYAENLILNTFLSAQRHVMFIIVAPLLFIFKDSATQINKIFLTLWSVYFCWAYVSFFNPRSKTWGVIKALIITMFFFVTNGLLLLIIFYSFFYKPPVQ